MARKDQGTVTIERDGVTYHGDWSIAKRMITVTLEGGETKTTQIGGSARAPASLARVLLSELVSRTTKQRL
jgi:hypothetical protein